MEYIIIALLVVIIGMIAQRKRQTGERFVLPVTEVSEHSCHRCSAALPEGTLRQHDGRRLCLRCKARA